MKVKIQSICSVYTAKKMCKIILRIKNNHFFKTKCVENQVIMSKSNQFTHIYVKIN